MNLRTQLISDIESTFESNEIPEEQLAILKDFIDTMESDFEKIAELLKNISINNLDNIQQAYELAEKTKTSLY